jgi:hypothetical protein
LRLAAPRGRAQLAEIIKIKDARRNKQKRAPAAKGPRRPLAVPGWAYFAGLLLIAAIVAALRGL